MKKRIKLQEAYHRLLTRARTPFRALNPLSSLSALVLSWPWPLTRPPLSAESGQTVTQPFWLWRRTPLGPSYCGLPLQMAWSLMKLWIEQSVPWSPPPPEHLECMVTQPVSERICTRGRERETRFSEYISVKWAWRRSWNRWSISDYLLDAWSYVSRSL